jgi:hypothetical protein
MAKVQGWNDRSIVHSATQIAERNVAAECAPRRPTRAARSRNLTKVPEGATTGVATGGTIGRTFGLLAGIGALAIPGLGPFVAAGPIRAVLASPGLRGTGGGLVSALVGIGIREYDAKRYEGRVKNGGILLSAHCDTSEEITRAKETLKRTGAEEIASTGEKSVGGYATTGHDSRRDVADQPSGERSAGYTQESDLRNERTDITWHNQYFHHQSPALRSDSPSLREGPRLQPGMKPTRPVCLGRP